MAAPLQGFPRSPENVSGNRLHSRGNTEQNRPSRNDVAWDLEVCSGSMPEVKTYNFIDRRFYRCLKGFMVRPIGPPSGTAPPVAPTPSEETDAVPAASSVPAIPAESVSVPQHLVA